MTDNEKVEKFLRDLTALSKAYDLWIGGCGCCGSPYIMKGNGDVIADELKVNINDEYDTSEMRYNERWSNL